MQAPLLFLGAAFLLSAPDSPLSAANADVPPRPIRGEVIINRRFLATDVLSEGLHLQDAARMTHCDFLWNLVWLELD